MLAKLAKEHGKEMESLNIGEEKVETDSATGKLLAKVAQSAAKGFEA